MLSLICIAYILKREIVSSIYKHASSFWQSGLDDREGDLTVDAIPNVLGIVKFTFGRSDVSRTTPVTWVDVRLNEHYEVSPDYYFLMMLPAPERVSFRNYVLRLRTLMTDAIFLNVL